MSTFTYKFKYYAVIECLWPVLLLTNKEDKQSWEVLFRWLILLGEHRLITHFLAMESGGKDIGLGRNNPESPEFLIDTYKLVHDFHRQINSDQKVKLKELE